MTQHLEMSAFGFRITYLRFHHTTKEYSNSNFTLFRIRAGASYSLGLIIYFLQKINSFALDKEDIRICCEEERCNARG